MSIKSTIRKKQIIRTATILFTEKGYNAVSMRDIAKTMGIKAASLYNHINSKQDILKDIIISLAEEFTKGMEIISTSNTNSIEKLKQIISLHIEISIHNPYGMASLNNDWMHLKDQLNYYIRLRTAYEDNFRSIIKKGIQNQEILNQNSEIILFSILTTLRSLYIWIPKKENLNQKELTESLSTILINGIRK